MLRSENTVHERALHCALEVTGAIISLNGMRTSARSRLRARRNNAMRFPGTPPHSLFRISELRQRSVQSAHGRARLLLRR